MKVTSCAVPVAIPFCAINQLNCSLCGVSFARRIDVPEPLRGWFVCDDILWDDLRVVSVLKRRSV